MSAREHSFLSIIFSIIIVLDNSKGVCVYVCVYEIERQKTR